MAFEYMKRICCWVRTPDWLTNGRLLPIFGMLFVFRWIKEMRTAYTSWPVRIRLIKAISCIQAPDELILCRCTLWAFTSLRNRMVKYLWSIYFIIRTHSKMAVNPISLLMNWFLLLAEVGGLLLFWKKTTSPNCSWHEAILKGFVGRICQMSMG